MKRWMLLILSCTVALASYAQDDAAKKASAAADHEASEERYKQISADVQSLMTAQEVQQKRLAALVDELRRSRDESTATAKHFVTHEELKELASTVQEIDRKREADKKLILEEIAKLGKLIQQVAAAPPVKEAVRVEKPDSEEKPDSTEKIKAPALPEKGFYHEVQKGEYFSLIVSAYNSEFKKDGKKTVTMKQVEEANPGINPKVLKVGQKIFIPDPTAK